MRGKAKKKEDVTGPPNLYTTTLQLHLGGSSGRSGWGAADLLVPKGGTDLSLRNLVLWWDSPRLSAGTSAGRRSATVALCNETSSHRASFARNRWPGPQQSVRRLLHTFSAHPLHKPDLTRSLTLPPAPHGPAGPRTASHSDATSRFHH